MTTVALLAELTALNTDYWNRVDQRREDPVDALYTQDGRLTAGSMTLSGRAAIRDFFERRNAEQQRTGRITRHQHSNLDLVSAEEGRVVSRSMIVVFAGVGPVPLTSALPSTIADVEDICVRDSQGALRFEQRILKPIFIGDGAAAFVRA